MTSSSQSTVNNDSLTLSQILMDLPTLFFMTSFSVFIYYFAKLTMQVERFKQKGGKSLIAGVDLDLEDREGFDEKRVHLLGGGLVASDGTNLYYQRKKYQMPNLIRPFFIVFNFFTYMAYGFICIYCKSPFINVIVARSQHLSNGGLDQSVGNQLPKYFRAISGLNGLMFLMLGLAVLNYGSRLETMISSTKS